MGVARRLRHQRHGCGVAAGRKQRLQRQSTTIIHGPWGDSMGEANKLRVSVCLKYDGDAPLLMVSSDGGSGEQTVKQLARRATGLHREVYSWGTNEDVLGGVPDEAQRDALNAALFGALRPDLPPESRGIEVLASFVALARRSLDARETEWSLSASAADDDGRRRINPLLAVANHLDWLCAVHVGRPGISVTAR